MKLAGRDPSFHFHVVAVSQVDGCVLLPLVALLQAVESVPISLSLC